ncbi:MAG TPA: AIR synthase-related protein, partial [Gaiellaceae bacterium]|nr:AIR synthase-related protein [Gaiellaceae bacterium]
VAHVTGGGIPGNLARVLPSGLGAVIEPDAWERPPVFRWLAGQGVAEDEQRRVFNLGIGYCAIVHPGDAGNTVLQANAGAGIIGRVAAGVDGVVFADAG